MDATSKVPVWMVANALSYSVHSDTLAGTLARGQGERVVVIQTP